MSNVAEPEPLIYRAEVTAILGALSDIVVDLHEIRRLLENDEEEEDEGRA